MEIAIYTLRSVAEALVNPYLAIMLVMLGFVFYRQNKRTTVMQKMIIGESINSPLELTMSQIVIGIFAGALGSIILSYLGVMFGENSGIEIIFILSILLVFVNPRFVCFSYSGAVLGVISIGVQLYNNPAAYIAKSPDIINKSLYIDIAALMTMVGILHIIEGFLVMIDGSRGAIPVFTNKDNKIVGGFALKRYWAMPIALFLILNNNLTIGGESLGTPEWWPIIKGSMNVDILKTAVLGLMPFYGVIGYNSVTFSRTKEEKSLLSGISILIYGVILTFVAQLANKGLAWEVFVLIFAPLAHEIMINLQKLLEGKAKAKYISDEEGIMILEVAPNSPAYNVGIKSGDKLLEINDSRIENEALIYNLINQSLNNIRLKIRDSAGKIRELNLSIKDNNKRIGVVLVPRGIPKDSMVVKFGENKFKDVLDKLKNEKNKNNEDEDDHKED